MSICELAETSARLNGIDTTVVDEEFSHSLGFTLRWLIRGRRDRGSVAIRLTVDAWSSPSVYAFRTSWFRCFATRFTFVPRHRGHEYSTRVRRQPRSVSWMAA